MPKHSKSLKRKPLIIGNWKMNPATLGGAQKLFLGIRDGIGRRRHDVDIVVAPPFPFISEMERITPSRRIELCAQDGSFEVGGAHTGEVSMTMLKSVGVTAVIVGHSERRASGETDEIVYKDVMAALKHSLTVILCVGEKKRDSHGDYLTFVETQLRTALKDVPKTKLKYMVIAYEPVWAIGTGKTATPEDAREMRIFIMKILSDLYDRKAAEQMRILYGGSVKPENAEDLLEVGEADGFLIGGASLKAKSFVSIINTAHDVAKKS